MVIAYLRISTGKQHIANQHDEIMRFALSKDLEIHKWVTEVVSGKKAKKERKLGKTLRRLKQGDILIVTELSRLSRKSRFTVRKTVMHSTTVLTARYFALHSAW